MTRKTYRTLSIATLAIALAILAFSCKKDEDPNIQSITFEREYFQYTPTTVTVSGVYAYDGRIDGIKMQVGQRNDLADARAFNANLDGTHFSVLVNDLQPGTEYHYCYEVDYGFSKPYKTETKTFATPADSPLVKTLDVMSIDSTSVRVNCETVSDCGMEITERGVCWNTYGNPNLDDEILAYASAGLGQYSCRINNLALGKKYYVKAYAKNASGIGFGEELEFETAAPPGMPVSIELSCDPEEGGSVSGGGIHTVGSQCTVTAVANSGYTFVNWTENGSQVSTEATYTFNVTRECHLVANFTTQAYIITAEVTPDNSGTVTGAGGYNYGEECTLTANAKPGYEFVKWTKNGTNVSTDASFTFTVNASATYVAHFQTKSYTVTVSAQPSNGGTVTGGGTFNYGQSCTVHAAPADGFAFINWTDGGDVVSSDANYTFTVTGNKSLLANFSQNGGGGAPIGAINGLFTINANGDQVYFSKGNLQYQASTNTWRFAENQWDYVGTQIPDGLGNVGGTVIGSDNNNISQTYSGWIDLFGWGTSGYTHGAMCYQPWSTSSEPVDYYAYGHYSYNLYDQTGQADWGYNAISNGGNTTNMWRTLTGGNHGEWRFIIESRYTLSGIHYAKAVVNGVNGVILLPDDWSTSYYSLNNTDIDDARYNSNVISSSEWISLLEQHGAIFLPAAGFRGLTSAHEVGVDGDYWSASSDYINTAWNVHFDDACLYFNFNVYRCDGFSVRLVQDYNP